MLAGEIAFERLQEAIKNRISAEDKPFGDHYDLSSFLRDELTTDGKPIDGSFIGRSDVLLELLKRAGLNTPRKLSSYLKDIVHDMDAGNIAAQIIDNILIQKPHLYKDYNKLMRAFEYRPQYAPKDRDKHLRDFMENWIKLEQLVRSQAKKINRKTTKYLLSNSYLSRYDIIPEQHLEQFGYIRQFRNELVHGHSRPTVAELKRANKSVQELITILSQQ